MSLIWGAQRHCMQAVALILGMATLVQPDPEPSSKWTAVISCRGKEVESTACPDQPECHPCTPQNCTFGDWEDWVKEGGCRGICQRFRSIRQANNECGVPCFGPKIETKNGPDCGPPARCIIDTKKKDCIFSAWSSWSECMNETQQSYRSREFNPPEDGGLPCEGKINETQPCADPGPDTTGVNCTFTDWSDWNSCSTTCDAGRFSRDRRIKSRAGEGGAACKGAISEQAPCSMGPCKPPTDCALTQWSQWSDCPEGTTQGDARPSSTRSRYVLQPATAGGRACDTSLEEMRHCNDTTIQVIKIPNCTVIWDEWTACDRTCGGGQRFRKQASKYDAGCFEPGEEAMVEGSMTEGCNLQPCDGAICSLSAWTTWAGCPKQCGVEGVAIRKRGLLQIGKAGCTAALQEVKACPSSTCNGTDCVWGDWDPWSACSCTCAGGSMRRNRVIVVSPRNGGKLCDPRAKSEVAACNTQPCDFCVNGTWQEWGEWSQCSGSCSPSYRERHRSVATHPNHCGRPADGHEDEYQLCPNLPPCTPSQDCKVSEWNSWSACTCTCYGMRERRRSIIQYASGNGLPCVDEVIAQYGPCNPAIGETADPECGPAKAMPCALSEWEPWGACSSTCDGGYRSRMRTLIKPNVAGGEPCKGTLSMTEPCATTPCNSVCIDCKWTVWADWGSCSKCGDQRYRYRSIDTMPTACGKKCTPGTSKEVSNCTSGCEKKYYCAWSDWSSESTCSAICGPASKTRQRQLTLLLDPPSLSTGLFFEGTGDSTCFGTQMETLACPFVSCTKPCEPLDCLFSDWDDWTRPSCTQLCERERNILRMGKCGGLICNGTLLETKSCPKDCDKPVDCKLGEWDDWKGFNGTECSGKSGTRVRTRPVIQPPRAGGKECNGTLQEASSCIRITIIEPCTFSPWEEWGTCSATCDTGMQTRLRYITQHATETGKQCEGNMEELRPCNTQPCRPTQPCYLTGWTDWSSCSSQNIQVRNRRTLFGKPSSTTEAPNRPPMEATTPVAPVTTKKPNHTTSTLPPAPLTPPPPPAEMPPTAPVTKKPKTTTSTSSPAPLVEPPPPPPPGTPPVAPVTKKPKTTDITTTTSSPAPLVETPPPPPEEMPPTAPVTKKPKTTNITTTTSSPAPLVEPPPPPPPETPPVAPVTKKPKTTNITTTTSSPAPLVEHPPPPPPETPPVAPVTKKPKTTNITTTTSSPAPLVEPPLPPPPETPPVAPVTKKPKQATPANTTSLAPLTEQPLSEPGLSTASPSQSTLKVSLPPLMEHPLSEPGLVSTSSAQSTTMQVLTMPPEPGIVETTTGQVLTMPPLAEQPLSEPGLVQPAATTTGQVLTMPPLAEQPLSEPGLAEQPLSESGLSTASPSQSTLNVSLPPLMEHPLSEPGLVSTSSAQSTTLQVGTMPPLQSSTLPPLSEEPSVPRRLEAANLTNQSNLTKCYGHLAEIRTCHIPPIDCEVTDWTHWDKCDRSCGGGQQFRNREVTTDVENGGKPCPIRLGEVRGCNKMPCINGTINCQMSDWGAWSKCSNSCGTGNTERTRLILSPAKEGGQGCNMETREVKPCSDLPVCPGGECIWGDWSEWNDCTCSCGGGQRKRKRSIKTFPAAGTNALCDPLDKEVIEPCNTEQCPSGEEPDKCTQGQWQDWDDWEPCTKTCEGGTMYRERNFESSRRRRRSKKCVIHPFGPNFEYGACNFHASCEPSQDCVFSQWEEWSGCTMPCSGTRKRVRTIKTPGRGHGKWCNGAIKQVKPCTEHSRGTLLNWKDPSMYLHLSNLSYSNLGHQGPDTSAPHMRFTNVTQDKGKALDLVLTAVGDYAAGNSTMNGLHGTFGGINVQSGTEARIDFALVNQASDAPVKASVMLLKFCDIDQGANGSRQSLLAQNLTDFKLGHASKVSHRIDPQTGSPEFIANAHGTDANNPTDPMALTTEQEANCVMLRFENLYNISITFRVTPSLAGKGRNFLFAARVCLDCEQDVCNQVPSVDCELSKWTPWSKCSVDCGGGQRERKRNVLTSPSGRSGRACDNSVKETEPCNTQPCKLCDPVDCVWGDWHDWGACSKCNGQRKRYRFVRQHSECGGTRCSPGDNKQISNCTRKCHDTVYCAWADWGAWSPTCPPCGAGSRERTRWLQHQRNPPHGYSQLQEQIEQEQAGMVGQQRIQRMQHFTVAFACGLLSVLFVLTVHRACKRGGHSNLQRSLPVYEALHTASPEDTLS